MIYATHITILTEYNPTEETLRGGSGLTIEDLAYQADQGDAIAVKVETKEATKKEIKASGEFFNLLDEEE